MAFRRDNMPLLIATCSRPTSAYAAPAAVMAAPASATMPATTTSKLGPTKNSAAMTTNPSAPIIVSAARARGRFFGAITTSRR